MLDRTSLTDTFSPELLGGMSFNHGLQVQAVLDSAKDAWATGFDARNS